MAGVQQRHRRGVPRQPGPGDLVGSLGGAPNHPDWVHNLRANPRAFVEVGESSYDIVARELPPAEHDETFPKVVALQPLFGEYQNRTTRVIPLFELQRV